MAITKKTTQNTTNANKPTLNIDNASVQAAYQISDSVICFTLNIPGASLRNMRLVAMNAGGYFVAAPQTKGKDGKYHDLYLVYLSERDEQRIIDTVLTHFAAKDEKRDFTTRYEV